MKKPAEYIKIVFQNHNRRTVTKSFVLFTSQGSQKVCECYEKKKFINTNCNEILQ